MDSAEAGQAEGGAGGEAGIEDGQADKLAEHAWPSAL